MSNEDLKDLDKHKDEELARLEARRAELESILKVREAAFKRETEQMKDFVARALKNLEESFLNEEEALKSEKKQIYIQTGSFEERLAQLKEEAAPQELEKKLRILEESFLSETEASTILEQPERLSNEIAGLRHEAEERIAAKSAEIARMKENLRILEREVSEDIHAFEKQKNASILAGRKAIEARQREIGKALSELESDLLRRRLHLEELQKLIAAREAWVGQEKTRRLDRIKTQALEFDRHVKILAEKLEQEKMFWESQLASACHEAGVLNGRLATSQAELSALKTQHRKELEQVLKQTKLDFLEKEKAMRLKWEEASCKLREVNAKVQESIDKMHVLQTSCEGEAAQWEAAWSDKKRLVLETVQKKEEELAHLRENSGKELASRLKELDQARQEYERKILTPVLEEKRRHILELEEEKQKLEQSFSQKEAEHARDLEKLTRECAQAQTKIGELEKEQVYEAHAHQEKIKELRERTAQILAPLNEKLGELSKSLELTKKRYAQEVERLEREKANFEIEADRKRLSLETGIQEKRKEILFTIDTLKASQEAQKNRWFKEEADLIASRDNLERQIQKIESDRSSQGQMHLRAQKEQESGIESSQIKLRRDIDKLQAEIHQVAEEAQKRVALRKEEIHDFEAKNREAFALISKAWAQEELDLEKKRVAFTDSIGNLQEVHSQDKKALEAEVGVLQSRYHELQKQFSAERENLEKVFEDLKKRKEELVVPLEEALNKLRKQKASLQSDKEAEMAEMNKTLEALESEMKSREHDFLKEAESRRNVLAQTLENLEVKYKQQEEEARRMVLGLTHDKERQENAIRAKEKAIEKIKMDAEKLRRNVEAFMAQERCRLEEEMGTTRAQWVEIQADLKVLQENKKNQLEQLEQKSAQMEKQHEAQMAALEKSYQEKINAYETEKTRIIQSLQGEINELLQVNECLTGKIKDANIEIDMFNNRKAESVLELERQKRHFLEQLRNERVSLARELRLARRFYKDDFRESEHDLYLARLKVELRLKRLGEIMEERKREFINKEQLTGRLSEMIKNLELQAKQLKLRKEELLREMDSLKHKKNTSKSLPKMQGIEWSHEMAKHEKMLQKAKARLEAFVVHMHQEIASKKAEVSNIAKALEQIDPLGEGVSRSLADLTLDWDREVRRVENLIKGLEASPFWRH